MTGSAAASAAPGPSASPSPVTSPAFAPAPAPRVAQNPPVVDAPRVADGTPEASDGTPRPTPPDAVATTIEELPAGFWDDEGPGAAPLAIAADRDAQTEGAAVAQAVPPPTPPRAPTSPPATAHAPGSPPALASLHGLALLQAVFPGRVVKVERAATADGDAVPDEASVADPIEAPDDDPDPGADAPLPRTP